MPGLLAQTLEFMTSSRLVPRQNAVGRKEFGTRGMMLLPTQAEHG
jgi:hypothetical protein